MASRLRTAVFLALTGAILVLGGCKENVMTDPPAPRIALPFPNSADQLLANFKATYESMDFDAYRDDVLGVGYTFVLQPGTVEEYGLADELFEYTDELVIALHMFSGQPNLHGYVLQDIVVQQLQPQGDWQPVTDGDLYFGDVPGAQVRNYQVLVYFDTQQDLRYIVQGSQLFYVVADTVVHEGAMTPRFSLVGQVDRIGSYGKSTEPDSWGSVKALFE